MNAVVSPNSNFPAFAVSSYEVASFRALSALIDLLPKAAQYGIGRTLRNRMLAVDTRCLTSTAHDHPIHSHGPPEKAGVEHHSVEVLLVTGSLGTGGVEAIVASLAQRLGTQDVLAHVLCSSGGVTADLLRDSKISVVECVDSQSAVAYIESLPRRLVVQLHNAPAHLVDACVRSGRTLVQVIHNTDINLTPQRWGHEAELAQHCAATVAVSETVLNFYEQHLPGTMRSPGVVIPNGVDSRPYDLAEISLSRDEVSRFLNLDLNEATVFVCLARYELQKNIPGLVAGFLRAAETNPALHLIVAGPPSDWLEYRLADALRRRSSAGGRVHLLGTCSPRVLLAAADAFLLDSFFEGWPVAVTEATMAGLPIVMSEVGGAAELIGSKGERGHLIPNPAGSPINMNLALIRRARRRVVDQRNRDELFRAIVETHDGMSDWRQRRLALATAARRWLGVTAMVDTHASLLKQVSVGWNPE